MSYKLNISSIAEKGITDASDWYYLRGYELKDKFLDAVNDALVRISESPFIYRPVHGKYRRALVKPFPYVIYFSIDIDTIKINSVFHTSRSPEILYKQLH